MVGRDAASLLNRVAGSGDRGSPDPEGVDADDRHAGFAVIENCRPHFASIVKDLVKLFSVVAGLFHPHLGRDVALGKAGFELGGLRLIGRCRAGGTQRNHGDDQDTTEEAMHGGGSFFGGSRRYVSFTPLTRSASFGVALFGS